MKLQVNFHYFGTVEISTISKMNKSTQFLLMSLAILIIVINLASLLWLFAYIPSRQTCTVQHTYAVVAHLFSLKTYSEKQQRFQDERAALQLRIVVCILFAKCVYFLFHQVLSNYFKEKESQL